MAHPRKNPPHHADDQIKGLAATGFTKVGIAAHFGITPGRLYEWMEENPLLKRAYDEGRE
jgi:hypothetical protein